MAYEWAILMIVLVAAILYSLGLFSPLNRTITQITVDLDPQSVAVNPNGKYAYVTNYNSNSISVISTASNTIMDTITNVKNPNGISDAISGGI